MSTIRIQSSKTITVTAGLQHQDVTNPDAHIPDRLKVSAEWPKFSIQIQEGVGYYPAEIAEWETVKALVRDGIFTISEGAGQAKEEDVEKVQSVPEEKQRKRVKKLEDLAGE